MLHHLAEIVACLPSAFPRFIVGYHLAKGCLVSIARRVTHPVVNPEALLRPLIVVVLVPSTLHKRGVDGRLPLYQRPATTNPYNENFPVSIVSLVILVLVR